MNITIAKNIEKDIPIIKNILKNREALLKSEDPMFFSITSSYFFISLFLIYDSGWSYLFPKFLLAFVGSIFLGIFTTTALPLLLNIKEYKIRNKIKNISPDFFTHINFYLLTSSYVKKIITELESLSSDTLKYQSTYFFQKDNLSKKSNNELFIDIISENFQHEEVFNTEVLKSYINSIEAINKENSVHCFLNKNFQLFFAKITIEDITNNQEYLLNIIKKYITNYDKSSQYLSKIQSINFNNFVVNNNKNNNTNTSTKTNILIKSI